MSSNKLVKEPRRTGRKSFEPTDDLRRQVEACAAFGLAQEDICRIIINPDTGKPVDLKTLRKYFRQELDVGASNATAKVVESLFRQAVGAPAQYDEDGRLVRAERAHVLAAAIFWMKTRAKWPGSAAADQSDANTDVAALETDRFDREV